jgi:hypothetical protein
MPTETNVRASVVTRRRAVGVAALLVVVVVGSAAWWIWSADSLRDRVESQVRTGAPPGTPRLDAAEWVSQTYGVLASYSPDPNGDRWVGQTVPDLAGVPADRLGGALRFAVQPRGRLGEVMQQVHRQQVIVYLLLDKDDRVCGYFFLSLEELRKMENEKRR